VQIAQVEEVPDSGPAPPRVIHRTVYVGPRENSFQSCTSCVGTLMLVGVLGVVILVAISFLGDWLNRTFPQPNQPPAATPKK
jgi:hypothetical protein